MAEILPSYPPSLPPKAYTFLLSSLVDYCLAHGITVRPVAPSEGNHLASHVPVTLFPSLFPRSAWEQSLGVQTTYNELYAKIANDVEWLGPIMEEYYHFQGKETNRDLWRSTTLLNNFGNCISTFGMKELSRYRYLLTSE